MTETTPRVILAHAGVQHSYKTAVALHGAGALRRFYTPLYAYPGHPLYRLARRVFPGHPLVASLLQRRYDPQIPAEAIRSLPWFEVVERLLVRAAGKGYSDAALTLRNDLFDRCVAASLAREAPHFDVFYGYSGCALHALHASRRLGKRSVLDQHAIHYGAAVRLLKEEIELHPEFADTIPYWPPYQPYLDRVEEENRIADHHVVLSCFAMRTYVEGGIDPRRISVVPLCVDISRFSPSRERFGTFRVLFVGAIAQMKGIKYLLEAFRQLRLPHAELILAGPLSGSGTGLRRYEGWFRRVGYVEPAEMPSLLQSSSVLVLPSVWDSFGQVIVEAMACGLPVIVSEHTGGRDIVRDGTDGYVVPIRDVDALKMRLETLYADAALRDWMGGNAAQRAREFTMERYRSGLRGAIAASGAAPTILARAVGSRTA